MEILCFFKKKYCNYYQVSFLKTVFHHISPWTLYKLDTFLWIENIPQHLVTKESLKHCTQNIVQHPVLKGQLLEKLLGNISWENARKVFAKKLSTIWLCIKIFEKRKCGSIFLLDLLLSWFITIKDSTVNSQLTPKYLLSPTVF